METVEGFDHQAGVHCGAAALRNVAEYYGWNYSEAACFGIGGGPAMVLYANPDRPWVTFRTSPLWLERAFLERLGVPHLFREGDDFATAWENVTDHVDEDDPVFLFLDPDALDYLPGEPQHLPPHVALVIGYDDEEVELSDGAMEDRQAVSLSTLRDAWTHDRFVSLSHEYLVVTNPRVSEDETDAAAAGLRQAATYVLDPIQVKRDARGPGEEGIAALRSFADYLSTWPQLSDPTEPVRAARRSIDEHGEGAAFRGLYAESLAELGRRTGIAIDLSDRMAAVGEEWRTVAGLLGTILRQPEPRAATFAEASSILADVADREEAIFDDLAAELGRIEQ